MISSSHTNSLTEENIKKITKDIEFATRCKDDQNPASMSSTNEKIDYEELDDLINDIDELLNYPVQSSIVEYRNTNSEQQINSQFNSEETICYSSQSSQQKEYLSPIIGHEENEMYGKILMKYIFSKYQDSIKVDNVKALYDTLIAEVLKYKTEISLLISVLLHYIYYRHITKTKIPIVFNTSEVFDMISRKYFDTFNWYNEAPSNDDLEEMCRNFEYQICSVLDICLSSLLVEWSINSFINSDVDESSQNCEIILPCKYAKQKRSIKYLMYEKNSLEEEYEHIKRSKNDLSLDY